MKLETLPNLVRDSKRFHQIVSTLVRYGLAPWLSHVKANWVRRYFQAADGLQLTAPTQLQFQRRKRPGNAADLAASGAQHSTYAALGGEEIHQGTAFLVRAAMQNVGGRSHVDNRQNAP
jgi:hypothetical protein